MVDFVLEDNGREAGNGLGAGLQRLRIDITDGDLAVAGHHAAHARDRQAAFGAVDDGAGQRVNADVGVGFEGFALLVEALDEDEAAVEADLRRGDADPFL